MTQNLLRKLYVDELKDLYSAGTPLVRALPKMAKAAASPALRAGFEGHLRQTREHVACVAKIFEALDESPKGKHGEGMEALINEGSEMIAEAREPEEFRCAADLRGPASRTLRNPAKKTADHGMPVINSSPPARRRFDL